MLAEKYLSELSSKKTLRVQNQYLELESFLKRVSHAENFALSKFSWMLFRGKDYQGSPINKNESMAVKLKRILSDIGDNYDSYEYAKMIIYSDTMKTSLGIEILDKLITEDFLPASTTLAKMFWTGKYFQRDKTRAYHYALRSIELGGSVGHRIRLSHEFENGLLSRKIKIILFEFPCYFVRHLIRVLKNPTSDKTLY